MKFLLTALCSLALTGSSFAEVTAEHKVLLQKFFTAINQAENFNRAIENSININPQQLAAMPVEQQAKLKAAFVRVRAFVSENMTWATVEDEMIEAYAAKLSVGELQVIVPGLDNPGARLYFQKMPELMPIAQKIGQDKVKLLQADIQKIVQEEMAK